MRLASLYGNKSDQVLNVKSRGHLLPLAHSRAVLKTRRDSRAVERGWRAHVAKPHPRALAHVGRAAKHSGISEPLECLLEYIRVR